MKNLIRNFTLVAMAFLAFSCSDPQQDDQNLNPTSIAKLVAATPNFSSFNKALELTGMDSMLDGEGDYTVFVPTDDAFAALLGSTTLEDFNTANPGVLADILKNHIINSKFLTKDLTDGQLITTSLGQTVEVDLQDNAYYPEYDADLGDFEQTSIYLDSARIFARDAKASNGTINVIDAVLVPMGS